MRQLWDNISVRHHHKKLEDKDWKYNYRWLDNFLLDSLRNISEEFESFYKFRLCAETWISNEQCDQMAKLFVQHETTCLNEKFAL